MNKHLGLKYYLAYLSTTILIIIILIDNLNIYLVIFILIYLTILLISFTATIYYKNMEDYLNRNKEEIKFIPIKRK